ncbi:MAG: type II secretion system protein [Gammaproteobacteria bacterium]|nr:MAG: type II secretion system protein [Gammaproteobacteria bacterium]
MRAERGFTLIELITVIILISILSVTLFSRLGSVGTANLQAGRDDLIAALFFAQQTAMARSNVQLILTTNAVSVTENGTPIIVHSRGYPLNFPNGVTTSAQTLTYDKLGRTTATTITLSASGASALVTVEASGYAH